MTYHPGGGGVAREEGPFAVPMAMKAVSSAPGVAAPKEDEGEGLVAMAAVAAGSAGPVASVAMAAVMVAEFAAPAAFVATEAAAAAGSADLAPSAVVAVVVAMGEADLVSAHPALAVFLLLWFPWRLGLVAGLLSVPWQQWRERRLLFLWLQLELQGEREGGREGGRDVLADVHVV